MNKKFIMIPTLLLAIGGGAVLAQTDYFEAALANPTVTAGQAKELALKEVTGDVISLDFDGDDLQPHYESDSVKDNEKMELKVDAASGAVKVTEREMIKKNVAQVTSAVLPVTKTDTISQEQAIDIALAKAAGTVTEIELDDDDNVLVYEIEIRNGKMEYDFKIDAISGAIVEYKEDLED